MEFTMKTNIKSLKEIGNNEYHKQYYAMLRNWAIEKLGGRCKRCGRTSKHKSIFDFHHENKDRSWSKGTQKNHSTKAVKYKEILRWKREDKIPEEVELLCATCHREIEEELDNRGGYRKR